MARNGLGRRRWTSTEKPPHRVRSPDGVIQESIEIRLKCQGRYAKRLKVTSGTAPSRRWGAINALVIRHHCCRGKMMARSNGHEDYDSVSPGLPIPTVGRN